MPQVTSSTPVTTIWAGRWTKSSHSNPYGNCVEVAELPGRKIAVRDSRYPDGSALICTRAEMAVFVQAVKKGEFEEMTGRGPARDGERPAGVSGGLAAV